MANLARSQVTFNDEWSEGRNRRIFNRDITLALSGQGGTTNKILASTLGFLKIIAVSGARDSSNNNILSAPSYDGSYIILSVLGAGTPADSSATIRMTVRGKVD